VERKPDAIDKRGRILTLTAAADEAIQAGDRASQQAQKMLLAPLTAKQRSALVDALDTILDAYNSTTRAPLHSEAPDVQKKD
jgi:DNA-binding MarR family transcriptional regulator